jgi:hypothetical protein
VLIYDVPHAGGLEGAANKAVEVDGPDEPAIFLDDKHERVSGAPCLHRLLDDAALGIECVVGIAALRLSATEVIPAAAQQVCELGGVAGSAGLTLTSLGVAVMLSILDQQALIRATPPLPWWGHGRPDMPRTEHVDVRSRDRSGRGRHEGAHGVRRAGG